MRCPIDLATVTFFEAEICWWIFLDVGNTRRLKLPILNKIELATCIVWLGRLLWVVEIQKLIRFKGFDTFSADLSI